MNKTLNITFSNNAPIKNVSNIKFRPYSSKEKGNKKLIRVLSAGNISNISTSKISKQNSFIDYYNLPSLNNFPIKIKSIKINDSKSEKNKYKIEVERIYEQNFHFKKVIRKLQSQIKSVKKEAQEKEDILDLKNKEIESLINENENNYLLNENYIPLNERGKYGLIKKMKNQVKETEQMLNEENSKYLKLKKNLKYTKKNEIEIENNIINNHKDKILKLIANSEEYKNNKNKEFYKNIILNNNLESQIKIIKNFNMKFKELEEEENYLKDEILKYEHLIDKISNNFKIIKLKQISLKSQNESLKEEKKNFIENYNNNKTISLEELNKKLIQVKGYYKYNKLKNKKTIEKLINAKKNFKSSAEQYKNLNSKKLLLNNSNELSKRSIVKNEVNQIENNNEEYINNLKKIYSQNKNKENDLEQGLFLFQQAIRRANNGENINLTQIKESILNTINNKNYQIDVNMINNT